MKKLRIGLIVLALVGAASNKVQAFANAQCCEEEECKVIETSPCCRCDCKVQAQTHFTERAQYSWVSVERESLFRGRTQMKNDDGGAFQAVLFGGKSTDRGRMATYFTPGCSSELRVAGGQAISSSTDVISDYFNVTTVNENFESIIRFAPQETTLGLGLTYQQRFGQKDNGKGYWIALSAPIMRVHNTLGFSEEIINDGGGAAYESAPANMKEAFRQASWCYGKVDCSEEKSVTRLGDIEALFGYDFAHYDDICHMEGYFGFVIPTGNKVKTHYIFESIVGREKHGGVEFGTTAQVRLWSDDTGYRTVDYHIHLHSMYLFQNVQTRVIPLVNKPWSQFMYVYKNQAEQQAALNAVTAGNTEAALTIGTPGVNVFAQNVKVSPGFQRAFTTAIEYIRCDLVLEAGYNFFARPAECVQLDCNWQKSAALRGQNRQGFVDNAILINTDYDNNNQNSNPADYNNFVITECDLDFDAAAHPALISHTFYGTVGYNWDSECYPMFLGLGGSYEFTRDNTGTDRWLLWGKWGISW